MVSSLTYTPLEEIPKVSPCLCGLELEEFHQYEQPSSPQIHASLHAAFANGTGKLASLQFRKNQLLQLGYVFKENVERWEEALAKDMGRPKLEACMYVLMLGLMQVP